MNGTGVKGGAFGFRVSSINKVHATEQPNITMSNSTLSAQLVDTKSINNTTLLHFLERTIAKHFPGMEDFLEELSKPAEAYRGWTLLLISMNPTHVLSQVNLQDIHRDASELRVGLKRIRQELADNFADTDQADKYGRQMWNFVKKAISQLEDLTDEINLADSTFTEVVKYFGEEDKNMSSSEFYGIFKTFVTSYKVSALLVFLSPVTQPFCRNARRITRPLPRNS